MVLGSTPICTLLPFGLNGLPRFSDFLIVADDTLDVVNASTPAKIAPVAVSTTVSQLPCSLNSSILFDVCAAFSTEAPYTVAAPIVAAAATVVAVEKAVSPPATIPIEVVANARLPPHVATVATTHAATTAAPRTQCHNAFPVGSNLFIGLFPQYANKLVPVVL